MFQSQSFSIGALEMDDADVNPFDGEFYPLIEFPAGMPCPHGRRKKKKKKYAY